MRTGYPNRWMPLPGLVGCLKKGRERVMPTGPRGEKRPPDVIENAVHVAQIATGEAWETYTNVSRSNTDRKKMPSAEGSKRDEHTPSWENSSGSLSSEG